MEAAVLNDLGKDLSRHIGQRHFLAGSLCRKRSTLTIQVADLIDKVVYSLYIY